MSDTTLYRINPKADNRDVYHAVSPDPGGEPALIPVNGLLAAEALHQTRACYQDWGSDECRCPNWTALMLDALTEEDHDEAAS